MNPDWPWWTQTDPRWTQTDPDEPRLTPMNPDWPLLLRGWWSWSGSGLPTRRGRSAWRTGWRYGRTWSRGIASGVYARTPTPRLASLPNQQTVHQSIQADQVTGTVFSSEHAFPSKFWIYLEHCPRGEAIITGHPLWGSQPRQKKLPFRPLLLLCENVGTN